jgi:aryl-alcohol dehydrogenase-like predicted oxidoreductase
MLIAERAIEGIGLGIAQFAFGDGTQEDSVATVHAALDAGVMLVDTVLAYTAPAPSPQLMHQSVPVRALTESVHAGVALVELLASGPEGFQ